MDVGAAFGVWVGRRVGGGGGGGGRGGRRRSAKGKREVTLPSLPSPLPFSFPSPQPFSTSVIRRQGLAGASCKNKKTGYTTLVARNSHLTNKPEADLELSPTVLRFTGI